MAIKRFLRSLPAATARETGADMAAVETKTSGGFLSENRAT